MTFSRLALAAAVCSSLLAPAPGAAATPAPYHHFSWQEVAPGVWFGLSLPGAFQSGNVAIVTLPGGGSMVVDTQNAGFIGQEILEKAKAVGHGPVKYVVNTHLHQDHVGGNIAFVRDYPHVQIIAHRNACAGIVEKTEPRMVSRLPAMQKTLDDLRARRAAMPDGTVAEAEARDFRMAGTARYLAEAGDFQWALPTQCLDLQPGEKKVITDGGRRIELLYFGPSHSNGDLVVFLPTEKVAMVGDLWGLNKVYDFLDAGLDGRDGSVLNVASVLKQVRALDFTIALTGHSPIAYGKASLDDAIAGGANIIAPIRAAAERGDSAATILQQMPAPAGAIPFVADVWRSIVTNVVDNVAQAKK